jgi:DHA1 family bicyclomycin/chloramphenicol resistance-like MFS transporter
MLPRVARTRLGNVRDSLRAYLPIVADPQAVGYVMLSALGFMGVVAFVSTASFVFVEYFGLGPRRFGAFFSFVMLGGSVGAFVNSRYVAELGISRMLGFGASCLGLSGLVTLLAAIFELGIFGLALPLMIYVMGLGFVFANSVARTLSRFPKSMGAASSIFGVNQFMLGGLLSALLSRIAEPTPMAMAATVAASGIACAALWWLVLAKSAPLRD